jgi:hypothetical protein
LTKLHGENRYGEFLEKRRYHIQLPIREITRGEGDLDEGAKEGQEAELLERVHRRRR